MIQVYQTPIYDTSEEILNQLQEPQYFKSFLAKMKILSFGTANKEFIKFDGYPRELMFKTEHVFPFSNNPTWKDWLEVGNTYIVSMCNRYHSQQLMPELQMFHFNCTKKQMLNPFHFRQGYLGSCLPQGIDPIWDENGQIINEVKIKRKKINKGVEFFKRFLYK